MYAPLTDHNPYQAHGTGSQDKIEVYEIGHFALDFGFMECLRLLLREHTLFRNAAKF